MGHAIFSYGKLETPGRFHHVVPAVMFVDIVKFTRYGDNDALRNGVRTLENAVSDVFEHLEWDLPVQDNDVIMLPTGDGYGIGFAPDIHDSTILNYAAELSTRLKERGFPVRIGINKGPCFVYKDLNSHLNLVGWGIVNAERAMSCGDRNHILCTDAFARQYLETRADPNLHEIGRYVAKGRTLQLYSYFSDHFGNPSSPQQGRVTKPKRRAR